ncbi:hypothetical protein [Metallosphaera hakonensis]|nr:hypothetical protein [Metallosphaera hakonensis]
MKRLVWEKMIALKLRAEILDPRGSVVRRLLHVNRWGSKFISYIESQGST